jgi:hypothetical protein
LKFFHSTILSWKFVHKFVLHISSHEDCVPDIVCHIIG